MYAVLLHLTSPSSFKKFSLLSGSVVRHLVGMAGEIPGSTLVPLPEATE